MLNTLYAMESLNVTEEELSELQNFRKQGTREFVSGRIGLNIRNDEPFTGVVDEVSIYNRALSEGEIKQNFAVKGA